MLDVTAVSSSSCTIFDFFESGRRLQTGIMVHKLHYRAHRTSVFLVCFLAFWLVACTPAQSELTFEEVEKIVPTAAPSATKPPLRATAALPTPTLPPETNSRLNKRGNTAVQRSQSALSAVHQTPNNDTLYQLPIAGKMNEDWIISNYVDHDWEAYQSSDYRKGSLTYDGHTGTDFLLRDLAKMEEGVAVLAARAGVVLDFYDEVNDRAEISDKSNFVLIEHADGSKALYQHLQQGSARVHIGDFVQAGQPIGLVGNSGNSMNPHLHFEVRAANGRLIDIFAEGLTAFDYPYPEQPYVLQAGVTYLSDPAIQNDMFRYTPRAEIALPGSASPAFWYKAVNVRTEDRLRSILIYPDGTEQELFTLQATQNASVTSWYVYVNPLPAGWYSVWYFFNDDVAHGGSLSFQIVP